MFFPLKKKKENLTLKVKNIFNGVDKNLPEEWSQQDPITSRESIQWSYFLGVMT